MHCYFLLVIGAALFSMNICANAATQNDKKFTTLPSKPTPSVAATKKSNININPPTKNAHGGTIRVAVVTSKPNTSVKPTNSAARNSNNVHIKTGKNVATTSSPTKANENSNSNNNTGSTSNPTKTKDNNLKNATSTKALGKIIKKNDSHRNKGHIGLSSNTFCTCDLQRYVCDINCCCDPDCTEADKDIFEYCEIDQNQYYDSSFCDYARHMYINNTPYQWLINQEDIFCVIKSNQPKSFLLQKKKAFTSFKSAEMEKQGEIFWNNVGQDRFDSNFKTVVYGDYLWVLNKDDSYRKLALPKSYFASTCIYQEDILYLNNMKSSCSQINNDNENPFLNLASYVEDKKIIAQPQYLNNVTRSSGFNGSLYQACPKTLCLPIEVYICSRSFKDCKTFNSSANIFNCSFDIRKNLINCFNAVEKVQYNLVHNGTIGLINVAVKAVLTNFSYQFGKENFEFEQEFFLNFRWIDQRENSSEILSGNPGYLIGKPIMVGMLTVIGNNSLIVRNSTKIVDNFLTLPGIENGNCIFDEDKLSLVEFGYNLISKCRFLLETTVRIKNSSANANQSCQLIQKSILKAMRISTIINKTIVVGLFGNADSQHTEDWNEFLFQINPLKLVNMTYGNFTNRNKTLECFGILTSISIDVLYSRVDFEDLLNQNKILALNYKFNDLRNFTFHLKNNETINLDFLLHSKVEFFDVTGEKKRKFVGAPSLKIQLPYDFFYPFVKIDNSSNNVMKSSSMSIVFLCFSIMWYF